VANHVVVDAGPLVAWLVRVDQHHDWAVTQFAALPAGLLTCEPVLTEASLLIAYHGGDPCVVMELVNRGVLKVPFGVEAESATLLRLMRRYRNIPMSLADACLVRMSETIEESQVLTTDGDFRIYRRFGRKVIPTIMPA
jgi:predicted nucleic acid-binding protein